jgi:hypothetical protein
MTDLRHVWHLLDIPVVRRPGNPQGLADLSHGHLLGLRQGAQLTDLAGRQGLGPAKQPVTDSRSLQPGMGPLPDEIPFKLGQRPEDMEDKLPATGRRVDLLLQGPEANAPLLELSDGLDQMRQGAAKPI